MVDLGSAIGPFFLALGAAVTNGAVGYGFPAIVTPVGLLFLSPLVLLPAVVAADVVVNAILLYRERAFIASTRGRAASVIYGLLPGIVIGTVALALIGSSAPNAIKLIVYGLLLPLCIIQLLGIRRPIERERRAGPVLGVALGCLYALTTISGPPLAIFWRNQGMSKQEFRCTMAIIRSAESSMTLGTYLVFQAFAGTAFYTSSSLQLVPILLAAVVIGVPVGTLFLRSATREFFARFIVAVDGLLVSFGIANTLGQLHVLTLAQSYLLTAALFAVVGVLAYYSIRRTPQVRGKPPSEPAASDGARAS
jgi:uncharacterized membrane protein YfcA